MKQQEMRDQLGEIADNIKQAECDLHALFSRLDRIAKQLADEPAERPAFSPAEPAEPLLPRIKTCPACQSLQIGLAPRGPQYALVCIVCRTRGPEKTTYDAARDAWNAMPRSTP